MLSVLVSVGQGSFGLTPCSRTLSWGLIREWLLASLYVRENEVRNNLFHHLGDVTIQTIFHFCIIDICVSFFLVHIFFHLVLWYWLGPHRSAE